MSEQTEPLAGQGYATFLRALAEHLDTHPDLTEPWIRPDRQLVIPDAGTSPQGFILWCRSLGVGDLRVRLFDEAAHVHAVNVALGEVTIADLWAGVDGLQRHLVQGGGYGSLPLTLAELEHYTEHGALPEAGGPR